MYTARHWLQTRSVGTLLRLMEPAPRRCIVYSCVADLLPAFAAARIWDRSLLAYLEFPMTPRLGLETK